MGFFSGFWMGAAIAVVTAPSEKWWVKVPVFLFCLAAFGVTAHTEVHG